MRARDLRCAVKSRKARSLALTACALVLIVICCFRQDIVDRSNKVLSPGLELNAEESVERPKIAIRSISEESIERPKIAIRSRSLSSKEYISGDSGHGPRDDYSSAAVSQQTYIAPLFSSEQMMNTLASFVDLCRIAVDWNASLVEPHICGSRLYGLIGLRDHWCPGSEKMHPYRTFYDLGQLNEVLACTKPRRCGLAPYEEFLQHSHRQLVILHALGPTQFVHFRNISEPPPASEPVQSTLIKCNEVFPSLADRVTNVLLARTKDKNLPRFHTPMLLCWNKAETVTTQSVLAAINSFMDPHSQNRFSVFFTTYSARQPEPGSGSFRDKFASNAVVGRFCQPRLLHSAPKLQMLATAFLKDLGLKEGQYVSVHIRVEKLVKLHGHNQTTCCLNALNSMVQSVRKMYNSETKLLVVTDVSPYGTDSCGSSGCLPRAQAAIKVIEKMGLKPTHFDPQKYSNYASNSVAGIVESEALSRGKSLITAGTGLFQASLINQYLTYQLTSTRSSQRLKKWHRSRHVYTVCRNTLTLPSSVAHPEELKSRITKSTACL